MEFPEINPHHEDDLQVENDDFFDNQGALHNPSTKYEPPQQSETRGYDWANLQANDNQPQSSYLPSFDMEIDEEEAKRIAERKKEEDERRRKIVAKMNEEIQLKQEWRDKARQFIDSYQAQREKAFEQRKQFNIANEQASLQNRALMKEGKQNPWEKVIENISIKESDYKGTKDITRMRNVILSRKNDFMQMKMK